MQNIVATKKQRAAAYARVSTTSDLQDGSFELQCSYYENFIRSNPALELVGIYGDHGKSGREMRKRSELCRLIKDCEEGKIDVIYTKSLSRFARNMMECVRTTRQLKEHGIRIIFEKEGIDTLSSTNELMLGILATIAQEESNSISRNIIWSRQKHLERGEPWDKPRYGYRSVGKNYEWQVVPAEAEIVKKAFSLAGMCHTYPEIREELNRMERQRHSQKIWSQNNLVNTLRSNVYLGEYLSNQKIVIYDSNGNSKRIYNDGQADQILIRDHHKPLVSRELYDAIQYLLDKGLLSSNKTHYSANDLTIMEHAMQLALKEMPA